MFGALGNIATLMKQARAMGQEMELLQEKLKERHATGSSGGGLVTVEINGLQEVSACRIDPKLLEPCSRDLGDRGSGERGSADRELLEDLICGAVNDAVAKSKQLHAEALQSMAGGLNVPGLAEMLGKLSGK
jgi:nucleoid-associated protein EbfC